MRKPEKGMRGICFFVIRHYPFVIRHWDFRRVFLFAWLHAPKTAFRAATRPPVATGLPAAATSACGLNREGPPEKQSQSGPSMKLLIAPVFSRSVTAALFAALVGCGFSAEAPKLQVDPS